MPKPISIASIIEANRVSSEVPFLCLIDVEISDQLTGEVQAIERFVRNPEPVVFKGHTYNPLNFDIQIKETSGSVGEVSLSIVDYDQLMQGYMEAWQGGVGSKVTFYLVNAARLDKDADVMEFFTILSASSSEYQHSFTLGAENPLLGEFPRRRQSRDYCQWRYKSAECGYSGGLPSCDLTLNGPNGCKTHGNIINFGAFPGISSNGYRYR